MATKLRGDLLLDPLGGTARGLGEWLTTFHLATIVLDPFADESSWILPTATRILDVLRGSHARVNFVLTADDDDARRFLGPIADRFLVFTDPERRLVAELGIERLPAFAFIRTDRDAIAVAQGWNSAEWRSVAEAIADATHWTAPEIPAAGDPGSFAGSPARG